MADAPVPMIPTRWPAEVHRLVRPVPGVQRPAREGVRARELRLVGRGQAAHRRDHVGGRRRRAVLGGDRPPVGGLVVDGAGHLGVEGEVLAQVQAVGHVLEVAQDLRLLGVALLQRPLLLQVAQERVGVVHALRVAARARVAVPVPGAADARPRPRSRARTCPARAAATPCTGRRTRLRSRSRPGRPGCSPAPPHSPLRPTWTRLPLNTRFDVTTDDKRLQRRRPSKPWGREKPGRGQIRPAAAKSSENQQISRPPAGWRSASRASILQAN